MAAPKPTATKITTAEERLAERAIEEVTPEVTAAAPPDQIVAARPLGIAPRPVFTTVVEETNTSVTTVRQLNPKTLAEQAAGKEAIAQYA